MDGINTENEALVRGLHRIIRVAVQALAILMTGVIVFGVADVKAGRLVG